MADINVIVLPDGTEYPVSDYYLPVAISNPTDGQVLKYDATNQLWYNGDDAEGSSVFYGTSAPTSQLGVNGNLYVKYTEGTGGASDTVDALYVKLDGAWCQISTGGGGGTSDYSDLTNKPQINSVELSGNKSLDDLGIQSSEISKTVTGSIVTFSDGGDDIPVSEYECEIVAQQASGTPSPLSPLPISGFSQSDIAVCGKNLWNETTRNGYYSVSTGIYQGVTGQLCIQDYIPVKPNTTYYCYKGSNANIGECLFYDENKTYINYITPANFNNHTFTTPNNCHYITFNLGNGYGTTYGNDISINYPSTDTQYHAYKGNAYTVAFGQTIYGGRLIYKNGQWSIEATHGFVEFDGSADENWNFVQVGSLYRPYIYVSGSNQPTNLAIRCNEFTPRAFVNRDNTIPDICWLSPANECLLAFNTNTITTLADWKTWLQSNPLQVVYELETPVIIPITSSTRVKTISGVNNIFSNTGDNSVKYFTENADSLAELIKASENESPGDYHEYSTEEHIVGKWIDGSPVYEKTLTPSDSYSSQFNYIPHGVSNFDQLFEYFGYCTYASSDKMNIPSIRGTSYVTVSSWDTTNIRLEKTNLSSGISNVKLVIRYTKSS